MKKLNIMVACLTALYALCICYMCYLYSSINDASAELNFSDLLREPQRNVIKRVFVSYAYSETALRKDSSQSLDFFLRHGVSVSNNPLLTVDYGLTVSGTCSKPQCDHPELFIFPNDQGATPHMQKLQRKNKGFDFGAHAAMLDHLDGQKKTPDYDAFVFLNDGVTGPITPTYMPNDWHWVSAFVDRIRGDVGIVGTSIVCLVEKDLGRYGPKVEGFAFALSSHALGIVRKKGTSFREHREKKWAILDGEYNMTTVLLDHGVQIDSLLKAYQGVDWKDKKQWDCNNHKWPSRSGEYFGTTINPMEVLFHKSHWYGEESVNEKLLEVYTQMADDSLERRISNRGNGNGAKNQVRMSIAGKHANTSIKVA